MMSVREFLGFSRAPFLLLAPACVILGYATARHDGFSVSILHLTLAFIGAIAAHSSVNIFNEYADFNSGLDSKTTRTPFSGGSGTLPGKPELAGMALVSAIVSALVVASIGIYFAVIRGWLIVPLGLAGLFLVVAYSFWIVRRPVLCLLAPGLGFGTFMVLGTHFALTGTYSLTAVLVSLVPFFLVSNLLLLNQFPDVEPDRSVGRSTLPVCIGTFGSAVVYTFFTVMAYLAISFGVLWGILPPLSLIGLGTAPLGITAIVGAFKNRDNIARLTPSMGLNVIVNLLTPVLVSAGILWG